ncbi:glycosyltransferase family 4 protein [Candidatus Epulonipiscium viviparus]|uniref:glycosyltransferase family 4 protein n=1 Tax=Candidatus Epulonipiscium viviparus TaxID=420336 RepID=UPI000690F2E1|nr:MraY family glycosyltransferase [Candidatus Epulopiscium viviparus]
MDKIGLYITAFVMAFSISLICTPIAKKIAIKLGAVAYPRKRDMHEIPIPRMGGIAIVVGFILTLVLILPDPEMDVLESRHTAGILIGGLIIFALGILDDIFELKSKIKLLVQVLAAMVAVYFGIRIQFVSVPFNDLINLEWLSIPVTIFWIVGITNAVNLIDGLDGLAAGVSSIASICLMILSIHSGHPTAVILTVILSASCLGFLPYNFNPASVFMGDTGSTFLGYMLSLISILGLLKSYTLGTVFVAVLILGLPIFDTSFAIIRRFLSGRPIMSPDRGHLHHRLVDKGYTQKQAVVTLYGVSGIFGLSAMGVMLNDIRFVLAVFIIMGILFYYNVKMHTLPSSKNEKEEQK